MTLLGKVLQSQHLFTIHFKYLQALTNAGLRGVNGTRAPLSGLFMLLPHTSHAHFSPFPSCRLYWKNNSKIQPVLSSVLKYFWSVKVVKWNSTQFSTPQKTGTELHMKDFKGNNGEALYCDILLKGMAFSMQGHERGKTSNRHAIRNITTIKERNTLREKETMLMCRIYHLFSDVCHRCTAVMLPAQ